MAHACHHKPSIVEWEWCPHGQVNQTFDANRIAVDETEPIVFLRLMLVDLIQATVHLLNIVSQYFFRICWICAVQISLPCSFMPTMILRHKTADRFDPLPIAGPTCLRIVIADFLRTLKISWIHRHIPKMCWTNRIHRHKFKPTVNFFACTIGIS